jgi:hypothetical protein
MGQKRDQRKRAKEAARRTEQHKKNRESKTNVTKAEQLKPKLGELPAKHVMDAIADSVHAAVTSVFDDMEKAGAVPPPATPGAKIQGRCMYYAAAGQWVASVITGRDYCVQVGSLGVMTDGENMVKFDAANGGVAARRFHMWMGADDGGLVDYVDFTSRFFKEWATDSGAKWERDDLPDYLWGKQKDIREQHNVYYQIEESEEADADKMIEANKEVIDLIVQRAVKIAQKTLLE